MPLLETSSNGDVLTIQFSEAKILDLLVIQNIQSELLATLGKTTEKTVVLDFSNVKFLSSGALGMLVRAHKKCKEYKVNMVMCRLIPSIREVFTLTGLDKALQIVDDPSEAAGAGAKKKGWFSR